MRSRQLRKALYDVDESIKSKLPIKNEDSDLDHELTYSKALIVFLKENSGFLGYPKVQEKFEMLEETLEDIQERYTLSKEKDIYQAAADNHLQEKQSGTGGCSKIKK